VNFSMTFLNTARDHSKDCKGTKCKQGSHKVNKKNLILTVLSFAFALPLRYIAVFSSTGPLLLIRHNLFSENLAD